MQENLVIVESPAKAKTIEKFLGKDFVVKSSFGHIRDLSKKDLGVNLDKDYEPVYEIPSDKRKVVEELSSLAKKTKTVWLASDEDREGEAIAWHLAEVLGLPIDQTKRIVFHEITKPAILAAIESPRTIDMNLVNAQQARRVLDRLVGFELSPLLWKKVRPQLSAGRVQSVAVRLLVEREREIIAFRSTPYYRVVAQFYAATDPDKTLFKAELSTRFDTREEAETFLRSCIDARFTVAKAEEKPAQRYPAPPFTTSTLQQEAGRKLGMSVSQTMSVAQHLYEQGLITYMRTDSVNLSKQAIGQCKEEIIKLFGEKYSSAHNYKTKTKGAQEAHEAIRPSYIERQTIEGTPAEKKLYDLIWKRTVASQMVPAELDRTTIVIDISGSDAQFVATGEVIRFDGFLKLYSESTDEEPGEEGSGILRSCIDARFTVAKAEEKPAQRYPAPPFTTSTLQQEAGRKLGMSVSQTMSVAQHLYEQGLITYMRTDSVNLSKQAIGQCKEEIIKLFGEKYSSAHNYKTKTKGAQEAHEAIRPSYIERQTIEGTPAEKKLYDLIWKRTVASQMVPAELDRTTIVIDISGSDAQFVATGEVIRFDGFLKLYSESTDEEPGEEGSGILPKMAQGESVNPAQITATERFTAPPARYNEASLVKRLEELGIGRPSTYAPTITTIINRGYVVKQNKEGQKRSYVQLTLTGSKIAEKRLTETYGKEKNRLQPTDIGMVVNDYLESQFEPIMDYNFTANVEKEFDRIADGEITWNSMIDDFYGPFHKMVDHATTTQTTKNNQIRILGTDPATGHTVKARIGRYGPMVEIEGNEGEKSRFASLKKGQLIESLTLEEALALFSLPRNLGPYEGEDLVIGIGKFGPYVRHGKSFASLARTDDPYTIGYDRAAELVREQQARAAAANTPLKTFAEEPELLIKNGRYGPYIAYKGKNYRIPKGTKPEEITLEACMKIIQTSKK